MIFRVVVVALSPSLLLASTSRSDTLLVGAALPLSCSALLSVLARLDAEADADAELELEAVLPSVVSSLALLRPLLVLLLPLEDCSLD